MKSRSFHLVIITAAACGLMGCATYSKVGERRPRYHPIGTAGSGSVQEQIVRASRVERSKPLTALAEYIAAAKTSEREIRRNPRNEQARSDYNFAVARIVSIVQDAKLDPWVRPLRVPASGGDFLLTHKPDPRPQWNPALYDFTPADQFDVRGTYVSKRIRREGIGAPIVVIGRELNKEARANFALPRVYYGVTAIARFEGRRCILVFEDPLSAETTRLGDRNYPLAADFTVPLAVLLARNDPNKLGLTRLLNPGKYAETAQIARLQPYDPNKRVVLVIHGLMDSQATWAPMINVLRGNERIRNNYQFWFYSYPSGYPYPYSAAILRRELDAVQRRFSLRKPIVVIGHSMGGCISRLLITDSGDKLWTHIFQKSPEQVLVRPETRKLLVEALFFRHRPEVGRVIFISSPLQGSDLARNWLGRFGSRLVRAPVTLLKAGSELLKVAIFQAGDLKIKRLPNSIDTLAPNNRFVKAINTIPLTPGISYHTIIGDRGRGDSPNSSDGVVPYWSSHMEGAQSELVVASGHGAHQNAQAIEEVRRILLLNAQ
jgi:pimeloyl-ACP methyl ester carboxylesterase